MKISLHRISAVQVAVLLLIVSAAACSILTPEDADGSLGEETLITLINNTDSPLVYGAWQWKASDSIDFEFRFKVDPGYEFLLQPGDSAVLTASRIQGGYILGDDVRLFLYEVIGDSALYRRALPLAHEELERRGFRLEISHIEEDALKVVNHSGKSLIYGAWERNAANLVDPNPRFEVED